MSVVGIDPSLTSCGIAVLGCAPGDVMAFGRPYAHADNVAHIEILRAVGHPGENGASYADRSDRIVSQTRLVLSLVPVDAELVVIEDMPQGIKSMPSLGDRWALWWGIYSTLRSRGTAIAVCNPKTRAKWATGYGNSDKATVVSHVRQQWPDANLHSARDDDRADALTMAAMGALHVGWTLPFPVKHRHHTGLEAVAWPRATATTTRGEQP